MKKRSLQLNPKLVLRKEAIATLNAKQQELLAGGQATETCQCPTPPVTMAYNCPESHKAQNSCAVCIRTIVNERTENLCY